MNDQSEDEWRGWKERERVDHARKIGIIALSSVSIYPLSKVYDAITLGLVEKISQRGRPAIYSLSENTNAYVVNTMLWSVVAALLIGLAAKLWLKRREDNRGPA